jgi:hypothetical protein
MDSAAVLRGEKRTIDPETESIIQIKMPMVRDYSTTGGHLPGDEIVEGPQKTVVKKWQGYPPENLNVVGKPLPSLPEVGIPRFTGKAQYASRVWFPNLLYVKLLTSPHPHARIKISIHLRPRMPGVAHVLTHKNVPRRARGPPAGDPLRRTQSSGRGGRVVAAKPKISPGCARAIRVDTSAPVRVDAQGRDSAERRSWAQDSISSDADGSEHSDVTWASQQGTSKGFAEADIVKSSPSRRLRSTPARWERRQVGRDKLTVWGMGQGICPPRAPGDRTRDGSVEHPIRQQLNGYCLEPPPRRPSASIR